MEQAADNTTATRKHRREPGDNAWRIKHVQFLGIRSRIILFVNTMILLTFSRRKRPFNHWAPVILAIIPGSSQARAPTICCTIDPSGRISKVCG